MPVKMILGKATEMHESLVTNPGFEHRLVRL